MDINHHMSTEYPAAAFFLAGDEEPFWGDTVVRQGHSDYCEEYGHAYGAVEGFDPTICPRCGHVLLSQPASGLAPAALEVLQADVYRQGREHAVAGGSLLSQARIDRVRVFVLSSLTVQDLTATNGQVEAIVDSYTEGYSLGLDEYAAINDDTE